MASIHRAPPGAKAPARLVSYGAAQALEAQTGHKPTPKQLAALDEATSRRVAPTTRCPTRIELAPLQRAPTFHRAGRLTADATLIPRRNVRFPDPCDTSEPIESRRNKLTRHAGIMLSGCAAESYATGSTFYQLMAVRIVAYSAFLLSEGCIDALYFAVMDFEDCASLALRHRWPVVETVEARLHAGQSADDVLIQVARAPANSSIQAALNCHLRRIGEDVTALAVTLLELGGGAR